MMLLKPSEIMFSQETINNYFDEKSDHGLTLIGETLDDLCEGLCLISDIPTIRVMKIDGEWVTADNRRLWVFRELERLGKCDKIQVRKTDYIDPSKLNSTNGGTSVRVRRYAGGRWHRKSSIHSQYHSGIVPSYTRNDNVYHSYSNVSPSYSSVLQSNSNVSPSYSNVSPSYSNVPPRYSNVSPSYSENPTSRNYQAVIPGSEYSSNSDRMSANNNEREEPSKWWCTIL